MHMFSAAVTRRALLMLLAAALTLLGIVAMSGWLADSTQTFSRSVGRITALRVAAGTLLSQLQDAEIGQRGYLLTEDRQYLKPYEAATAAVDSTIVRLRDLAGGDADELRIIDRLAVLADAKREELAQTITLMEAGRRDEALAVVRTGRGMMLMDDARRSLADLITPADAQLDTQLSALIGQARASGWVANLGGLFIVLVVGGAVWIALRYTRGLMRAQRAIQALNDSLEQRVSERTMELQRANDEIQRFAYIVSHDLRAPLVNVMGFTGEFEVGLASVRAHLDRLPSDGDDAAASEARRAVVEDMPEAIGFIRASTTKMDRLINAILALSRQGGRTLNPEPVSMQALLENVVASLRHQASEQRCTIDIKEPLPSLLSDRLALEQVFGNLLDNAIKYLDPARTGRIAIHGRVEENRLIFEVADNGRGIAPQDHERIFELFRRSGVQDRPGEGIGLAYVRTLIRRLQGEVTVESVPGQGSVFRITLPKALALPLEKTVHDA
ncbi:histidine kinase (plasmid) [Azospirillum baldaniorum]|uniref:histidine kinase n=1 Tax=Azospirillum baldaniorum TaxID=1064539 RepID=A0A9P1JZ07_9PROT|nr:CHASE3 domain-containing protein [Azospirillum baldaniorum]AWJ92979.1 histidine kinase [Azospirillum baldaniorum]NUB06700.1 GHKL domain-containing protein [Azospirillum baldaniorum]CCD02445.1 putative two-component sensor histidine kinase [Azospirillum baldaniorum]